jgi:hypothetical protein
MSAPTRRRLLVLGVLVGIAAGALLVSRPDDPARPPAAGVSAPPPPGAGGERAERPEAVDGSPDRGLATGGGERSAPVVPEGSDPDFESALRWSAVDLDAVRDALPDNLYWEMSAPTSDPAEMARREEERARWNREYGKVLSGTATDQEIDAYFALRRTISEDAIAFSDHLLDHYGDVLPERDVGLLELARRLHRARLEEMPRRMADARERKREQDRLREAWLADEAAFESAQAPPDD